MSPLRLPEPVAGTARPLECVSLVHGFLANTLMLSLLGRRLRRRGYETSAWGYRNMCCSIRVHARRFAEALQTLDAQPDIGTIHLVTHSMGGIVARAALELFRPGKLGRFVMLAPPNRGSFVATAAAGMLGGVFRPVAELSTAEDSFVNSLGMPHDVEVGVIAAGRDALVTEESTHPDTPHAHVTLPCLHSSLLFRRDTADLVAAFLASGDFAASGVPSSRPSGRAMPRNEGRGP